MPYIKTKNRNELDPTIGTGQAAVSPGELNFQITRLVDDYIERVGLNYNSVNVAIGVLECAKMELYRRIAAPYENNKIAESGDVYKCHHSAQFAGWGS